MLANTARDSRTLDDDARERCARSRRDASPIGVARTGARRKRTSADLNHISYFYRFHVSLNMTIRDDFDHHRGTRSTQESRLSKFPILEGKAYMFSQGLMRIIQYYKIFNAIKLP